MSPFLPRWAAMVAGIAVTFYPTVLPAWHTGLVDASGKSIFSAEFVRDYQAADQALTTTGSVGPYLTLLTKCKDPNELAELELTVGVIYCQRTGHVDPKKAVKHLTNALGYKLPERAYLDTLLWRAGSLEQLGKLDEARRDHLRGLLACSYYDLPSKRPELTGPKAEFSIEPGNDAEVEAKRDYERYRASVILQQHIMMQQAYFLQGVKRICARSPLNEDQLQEELEALTPDVQKREAILHSFAPPPPRLGDD